MHGKYKNTATVAIPTVSDAIRMVQNDAGFPAPRQPQTLSSLRQLPPWANSISYRALEWTIETMPFNSKLIEDLFARLVPAIVGKSPKRLRNALSDCRFVMERYGLSRKRLRVTLSPATKELEDKLQNEFDRMGIRPLLVFSSVEGIDPSDMNDAIAEEFRQWLHLLGYKNPDKIWRRSLKKWNKALARPDWPQVRLTVPPKREPWGTPWKAFPTSLEPQVDGFLARGQKAGSLFAAAAPALKPITIATQKESMRFAASALVRSGLKPEQIKNIRDLCRPERYRRALDQLASQIGCANATLGQVAYVLAKVAKYAAVLTKKEIKEVQEAHASVRRQVKEYMKTKEDRDQVLLDRLDDPKVVDALLLWPGEVVRRVLALGKMTCREAVAVQLALMLAIWLDAPLRLKNMRHLRIEEHFFKLTFEDVDYVVIKIPASEVKNAKPLEHFLAEETVAILELYLEKFLPMLTRHNPSPYLFPGRAGQPKTPQAIRQQMKTFVREGTGLDFHPHVIRKIVTKIWFDLDHSGIEVARRNLGDSEEVTRKIYMQRHSRAANRKYLEALGQRRLKAFNTFRRVRRKKGKKG